ncbi:MAG: subtilase-type protease inhibitor [Dactylosporangium sp.]|nr:subtilase-type protease inhibitor [Dactylosporangium sp.]
MATAVVTGLIASATVVMATPAAAAPQRLSMLDVTIGAPRGVESGGRTEPVTVWAMCSPLQVGSHPYLAEVCEELAAAQGNPEDVPPLADEKCPEYLEPVDISVEGYWDGVPVSFSATEPNEVCASSSHGHLFRLLSHLMKVTMGVPQGPGVDDRTEPLTAWLMCAPVQQGDHPYLTAACEELAAAAGRVENVPPVPNSVCLAYWQPVDISAQGYWDGVPVSFSATESNQQCASFSHGHLFQLL